MCGTEIPKCGGKPGGGLRRKQLNYSQRIRDTKEETKILWESQASQGKKVFRGSQRLRNTTIKQEEPKYSTHT
jgi:hypothetical protein